jgi:hypothetical protein
VIISLKRERRLYASANTLFGSLGKVKKMIENLGRVPSDPSRLATHCDLKILFSIVPGRDLKKEAFAFSGNNISGGVSDKDRQHQQYCEAVAAIPYCLGGEEALSVFDSPYRKDASMYDFINVFTEHAKTLPIGQKIEVETNAGALAAWISTHKRKFI